MGQSKIKWYVSLFGSEEELRRLNGFLDSPNCCLQRLNERCYLTSCRFSNLEDAQDVCYSAKKLLTLIKAFAKLELGGEFLSIRIGSGKVVVDTTNVASIIQRVDGNQSVWVYPTAPGAIASVGSSETCGAELTKLPQREKQIHDGYLNQCDEEIDSEVFDALYYFAEETSFYSLYKAYETIKIDVDGNLKLDKSKIYDKKWATEDEVRDFKQSANCHGAVRDPKGKYKLRHSIAECRRSVTAPSVILDLEGAESFIRHLMKEWLQWKRSQALLDALGLMLLYSF